jgi:hypothetical protein
MKKSSFIFIAFIMLVSAKSFSQKLNYEELKVISDNTISALISDKLISRNLELTIDSAFVNKGEKYLKLYFSKELTFLPIRENWLINFKSTVRDAQKRRIRKDYTISIYSDNKPLITYIPNLYREMVNTDSLRLETRKYKSTHVKNTSLPVVISSGLQNKHIAVWGGHGMYYSNADSLWKWQRPNLFTTVEDLFAYSYVVPYIIPMLENAGANVYYPKERDTQLQEIIVDSDSDESLVGLSGGVITKEGGFKLKEFYADYENPFLLGSHHEMKTFQNSGRLDSIVYNVKGADNGDFNLYISYSKVENNVTDVQYDVYHDGGKTSFVVNETMGYGTWVFLGNFHFGVRADARIVVKNLSEQVGVITSDAIKIGGGFNRIKREETISNKPAYMNAARYYLQYAGIVDSAVYTLSKYVNDYKDDYRSRGEWVDYLLGQPYCANRDSSLQGLGIPIDLSLAFHTDASTTKTDSVVGTLTIHSTYGLLGERFFPDGRSRFASRDLADVVHTEIVNTIQQKYKTDWVRREMWDKKYSEVTYPNVPSVLIELLSHQNFGDMKYGLDPNFKFDASRAIYKGVLKYLASQTGESYIVSPLAPNSFSVNYSKGKLTLNWKESEDEYEETAKADAYIVFTKIGNGGFDNGVLVKDTTFVYDDFQLGKPYSFKVKAVNRGGVSFDSEILSACIFRKSDNLVLIVNAFDKVSAPEYFDTDSLGGFADWKKSAIASGMDVSYTGNQYNFDKNTPWVTNPLTGHGASYSDAANKLVAGNTFDYPLVHGNFYFDEKISYISCSVRAFEQNTDDYLSFDKIDFIYGKQSTYNSVAGKKDYSLFAEETRRALSRWLSRDKSIIISGAFVASDVFLENVVDTLRTSWVSEKLNYTVVTDHASTNGEITDGRNKFRINKKAIDKKYELRSIDALENIEGGKVIFRYSENNYPAGVTSEINGYRVVVLGFPLESVVEGNKVFTQEILQILRWYNPK